VVPAVLGKFSFEFGHMLLLATAEKRRIPFFLKLSGRTTQHRQVCKLRNRLDLQQWAIRDQNTPTISPEKQHVSQAGAVKGAAENGDSGFTVAITAIMALPLTDNEKAEAVRRLLAGKGAK